AAYRPACVTAGAHAGVVAEREHEPVREVDDVADHARAAAAGGERGPEPQRDVPPPPADLLGDAQRAGQDDRADSSARERAPGGHAARSRGSASASAIETAALISARCVSPCGKLPRNSAVCGSISSA